MSESLAQLRERIDAVDVELQRLMNERADLAHQVACAKRDDEAAALYYRPEREAQVLERIKQRNDGPLDGEIVAGLFRELMSACLALEQRIEVAFLGPEGTFTQQASIKYFGHAVQTQPLATIDEVFREVESGAAHYGVVPVENSTEGVVNHTLDSFMTSSLQICGEVEQRIHHHLLVGDNTQRDHISRVYAHQQTLAQCRQWLDRYLPGAERVAVNSNADAARRVRGEWNAAAIAGDMAAEIYQLQIMQGNIEDSPDNTTRFIVIGRQDVAASGNDKTSLLVSGKDQPGLLYHVLEPFRKQALNLTRLESRPSRLGNWSYVFFIDFDGHRDDSAAQAALNELDELGMTVRFLGSYPQAVL